MNEVEGKWDGLKDSVSSSRKSREELKSHPIVNRQIQRNGDFYERKSC